MHKSCLAAFVLDSQVDDIQPATDFWSQALGYPQLPSDPEWAERYAYLDNPTSEPRLLLQKVEHPSHIHLDIETDHIQAEVERLCKLGAVVVKQMPRWTVMKARAPVSLRSEQQSCLKRTQSRRDSEGIVALFRAVTTLNEGFSGAPEGRVQNCRMRR